MLALEADILSLEPGNEGSDAFSLSRVDGVPQVSRCIANKAVVAIVANDVSAEGANGEKRGGHDCTRLDEMIARLAAPGEPAGVYPRIWTGMIRQLRTTGHQSSGGSTSSK